MNYCLCIQEEAGHSYTNVYSVCDFSERGSFIEFESLDILAHQDSNRCAIFPSDAQTDVLFSPMAS